MSKTQQTMQIAKLIRFCLIYLRKALIIHFASFGKDNTCMGKSVACVTKLSVQKNGFSHLRFWYMLKLTKATEHLCCLLGYR